MRGLLASTRAFASGTQAGATSIAAVLLTAGTVAAAALATDHLWLVDQRDVLKTAAEAASIAATLDIDRQLTTDPDISDADLEAALIPTANRYVLVNLTHLAPERLQKATESLEVTLTLDRAQRTVGVTARADLGGTLLSRHLPLLGEYEGPEAIAVKAGVQNEATPVELVLAIDTSETMKLNLEGRYAAWGSDQRMAHVKRAARALVDVLQPDAHSHVAIGVVPWDWDVRLDTQSAERWARNGWARYPTRRTYHIPWISSSGLGEPVVDDLPDTPPGAWRGCLDTHRLAGRRGRGRSHAPKPDASRLFVSPEVRNPFAQNYFPPNPFRTYRCRAVSEMPVNASTLCYEEVPERAQESCSPRRAVLLPLNSDPTVVKTAINELKPEGGSTNSSVGVMWAQLMLEPSWKNVWGAAIGPADLTDTRHAQLRKAIVLLTDGSDSYCVNSADCSNIPGALSRTEVCAAAKERGTEIFVIAAMPPGQISDGLKRSLRECSSASDDEYPQGTRRPDSTYVFINNATSADLEAAFSDIASQIGTLRKAY